MREILDELPRFCRQYFRGIEESTGARTRLAYAYDLRIFFEFIESENSAMKGTAIRDYPVSILEQIGKEDIEEFLEYLTYYEKDGQVFTNDARGKARKLSAVHLPMTLAERPENSQLSAACLNISILRKYYPGMYPRLSRFLSFMRNRSSVWMRMR